MLSSKAMVRKSWKTFAWFWIEFGWKNEFWCHSRVSGVLFGYFLLLVCLWLRFPMYCKMIRVACDFWEWWIWSSGVLIMGRSEWPGMLSPMNSASPWFHDLSHPLEFSIWDNWDWIIQEGFGSWNDTTWWFGWDCRVVALGSSPVEQ